MAVENFDDDFSLFDLNSTGKSEEKAQTAVVEKEIKKAAVNSANKAPKNDVVDDFSLTSVVPARVVVKEDDKVVSGTAKMSNVSGFKQYGGGIAVAVLVLSFIIGIPVWNMKRNSQLGLNTINEIDKIEKQIEIARESGDEEEVNRKYDELVVKQRLLDSLSKSDKKVEATLNARGSTDSLDVFIKQIMKDFYADNYDIPPTLRERISYYVDYFSKGSGRKGMQLVIDRKSQYFPYINKVFKENHIPPVLRYVAMQESLLNPAVKSHVGAAGLWQFMPATARTYGLTVSGGKDQRLEWRLATEAAAKYFRTLLVLFGKGDGVLLAIASYNAGEGKIQKALRKVEDPLLHRNFGYLYRTSTLLAKETREYVPQIIARAIIDQNQEYFGFAD